MKTSLPEQFENFADARRQGFLKIKELKDSGKNICGSFCQYTPAEIIVSGRIVRKKRIIDSDSRNKTSKEFVSVD